MMSLVISNYYPRKKRALAKMRDVLVRVGGSPWRSFLVRMRLSLARFAYFAHSVVLRRFSMWYQKGALRNACIFGGAAYGGDLDDICPCVVYFVSAATGPFRPESKSGAIDGPFALGCQINKTESIY